MEYSKEKVKVGKMLCEALDYYLKHNTKDVLLYSHHYKITNKEYWLNYTEFNKVSIEQMRGILFNGYECYRKEEMELMEWYAQLDSLGDKLSAIDIKIGIRNTLKTLGIKIDGIN